MADCLPHASIPPGGGLFGVPPPARFPSSPTGARRWRALAPPQRAAGGLGRRVGLADARPTARHPVGLPPALGAARARPTAPTDPAVSL